MFTVYNMDVPAAINTKDPILFENKLINIWNVLQNKPELSWWKLWWIEIFQSNFYEYFMYDFTIFYFAYYITLKFATS